MMLMVLCLALSVAALGLRVLRLERQVDELRSARPPRTPRSWRL